MDDLISMAAAIECAIDAVDDWDGGWNPNRETVIKKYFEELPAVDAAQVVHGNWKIMSHGFPPEPCTVCSNYGLDIDYEICKRIKANSFSYTSIKPNYCPNCGAKMDEEG